MKITLKVQEHPINEISDSLNKFYMKIFFKFFNIIYLFFIKLYFKFIMTEKYCFYNIELIRVLYNSYKY